MARLQIQDGRVVMQAGQCIVGPDDSCCCEGCEIAADNFNRTDAENINTSAPFTWTGDATNIAIVSNKLSISTGSASKLVCGTPHPDASSDGIVAATFTTEADGDEVEVWLNGFDDVDIAPDFCTVARLTTGAAGKLEIIDRQSGDTVAIDKDLSLSGAGTYTLKLLYDSSTQRARAVVDDDDDLSVCSVPDVYALGAIGSYAGIGVGDYDDTILVDDFAFGRLGNGSNGCEILECTLDVDCGGCEIGEVPDTVTVTISGVVAGTCGDGGCAIFNGTHVLDLFSAGSVCTYFLSLSGPICGGSVGPGIDIVLQSFSGATPEILVSANYSGATFQWIGSGVRSCTGINSQDVPFFDDGVSPICDFSSATCTVTTS